MPERRGSGIADRAAFGERRWRSIVPRRPSALSPPTGSRAVRASGGRLWPEMLGAVRRPVDYWLGRLAALIAKGEVMPMTPMASGDPSPKGAPLAEWCSQSLATVRGVLGSSDPRCRPFESHPGGYGERRHQYDTGMGVLRGLREDVAHGHLDSLAAEVAAEVFSDFMDMADHLFDEGLHHPAAYLAGAVLEEHLRRLVAGSGGKPANQLGKLNDQCISAKVYSVSEGGIVKQWARLRNDADHGQFEKVEAGPVSDMLRGVRRILAEYPA
jgi:hypothetical protein